MSRVAVRRAELQDLDALAPLFTGYREFYGQAKDVQADKDFLSRRLKHEESVVFLAFLDQKAVGFVQLYPTFSSVALKRDWILNDLFVDPNARGQGAGHVLLEAARQFGQQNGARRLMLETQTDNPARFLYEKAGWRRDTHLHYFIHCSR